MTPPATHSVPLVRFHDVTSGDGTRVRAWTNGLDGPPVLVSNGLGTNPHAWPMLLRDDCGLRVVGWNHRGVGGSERPASGRVDLDSLVEDAVAVMDDAGLDTAVVASWSTGVTVAFELGRRFPDRVQGILAVAGVPGDAFSSMLEPLRVPAPVARPLMIGVARGAQLGGHVLGQVTRRVPWTRWTADLVRATRLISPSADTEELRLLLREFFTTDPDWYAHLALAVSEHSRVSLSAVSVPTTFLAGRHDVLAGARSMRGAALRVRGSRFRELDASHFVTVEQPQLVLDELRLLVDRAGQAGA